LFENAVPIRVLTGCSSINLSGNTRIKNEQQTRCNDENISKTSACCKKFKRRFHPGRGHDLPIGRFSDVVGALYQFHVWYWVRETRPGRLARDTNPAPTNGNAAVNQLLGDSKWDLDGLLQSGRNQHGQCRRCVYDHDHDCNAHFERYARPAGLLHEEDVEGNGDSDLDQLKPTADAKLADLRVTSWDSILRLQSQIDSIEV